MVDVGKKFLISGILVVFAGFILSCPNPIDRQLAWQAEDTAAPVVTIITPDPNVKYYYPSLLEVQGTVVDYTDAVGGVEGTVTSLHYEEQYNKRVHGDIDVQSDGSFSFSFNTKDPEILQGTLYIVISATDWNGNISETIVTAYDKTTGPLIAVYNAEDFDWYSSNPATDQDITVTGRVDFTGSLSMKYTIESEVGPDPQAGINGATGEFSFTFNPSDEGVSGKLTILIEASDIDGPSNYFLYLDDDPEPPQFHTDSQLNSDNSQADLVFTEGVYHTGQTAPLYGDFALTFTPGPGSGTVTDVSTTSLVGTPAGGESAISLSLAIQPVGGIAYGDEIVTITASNITDHVGNAINPSSVQLNLSDQTGPSVVSIDTTLALGTAVNATETVPIDVRFSEPVNVSSLQLALNAGTGAVAVYDHMDPSDDRVALLTYDVSVGHNVVPLDYISANALTGSVEDLTGNAAVLALGTVGSSALWGRNITIDTIAPNAPTKVDIDDTVGSVINQSENSSGVLFTIDGEAGTYYNIEQLHNCTLYQGSLSGGPLPLSGDLKIKASGDGNVYVVVTLEDAAGNVSPPMQSDTVTADLTPPSPPNFESTPTLTNDDTPTWQWSSGGGDGIGTFRYKLDGGTWSTGSTSTTYTPPSSLSQGPHTLSVEERDAAGNWSNSASWTITVDLTPPSPPDFVTTPHSTNDDTPTWQWNSGGGGNGTYRHRLEDGSGSTSPAPLHNWTSGSTATTYTPPSSLAEGQYTLYVQERDAAGNWSNSASCTITVDLSPPSAPVFDTSPGSTTNRKPTWEWHSGGSGNGTFRHRLENASGQTTPSPLHDWTSGSPDTTYTPGTNLEYEDHTLYVQERDAAGNWSTSASCTLTITN